MRLWARGFLSRVGGGTEDAGSRLASALRNTRLESWPVSLALSFCVALVVFGVTLRFSIINPTHINWCLSSQSGDLSSYFFSFAYYRHAAWGFPLAHFDSLSYPVGTSLLVTDGLPLAAIPLKVFDRFLPERFQFLGPWLFLGIWLQCFCAERFSRVLKLPDLWCWLTALLATTAPPFIGRFGHVALSSHWVILLSMTALCRKVPSAALWFVPIVALWIHPYLFAITLGLSIAGQLRFARQPGALSRLGALCVGLFGSLWVLGYFDLAETRGGRFEYFSSDLTSLVNSMGDGRFLPSRALGRGAWEGSAYLGAGGLVLCAVLLATWIVPRWRRKSEPSWWLLGPCVAMALYSLSTSVHFLGAEVVHLRFLTPVIAPFSSRFRSCGRFIWPLFYYLLFFGSRALHVVRGTARWLDFAVPALLALQIVDIWPAITDPVARAELNSTPNVPEVPQEISSQLTAETRFLIFDPPVKTSCDGHAWRGPYSQLAWFGALHRLKTNASFGQARVASSETLRVCDYTKDMYRHRRHHPEAIFVLP